MEDWYDTACAKQSGPSVKEGSLLKLALQGLTSLSTVTPSMPLSITLPYPTLPTGGRPANGAPWTLRTIAWATTSAGLSNYPTLNPTYPKPYPTHRWETGYWCTMDIAHDRAGYYLCWGCLVWVPAIYTSPALFLVSHPMRWGPAAATAIALAGAASIYINYDSDRQRQARHAPSPCSLDVVRRCVSFFLSTAGPRYGGRSAGTTCP